MKFVRGEMRRTRFERNVCVEAHATFALYGIFISTSGKFCAGTLRRESRNLSRFFTLTKLLVSFSAQFFVKISQVQVT